MKSITRLSLALIMFSLFSISYLITSASAQSYNTSGSQNSGGSYNSSGSQNSGGSYNSSGSQNSGGSYNSSGSQNKGVDSALPMSDIRCNAAPTARDYRCPGFVGP